MREVALSIQPSSAMTDAQQSHLQTVLTSSLSGAGVSVRPKDSGVGELSGEIQLYNPGNNMLRWMFGLFGAGHGHFESTWKVVDGMGKEVGACRVDGSIKMGAFGGKYDAVLKIAGQRLGGFLTGSK